MLILTRSDVLAVLDMAQVIEAVEAAHAAVAEGRGRDLGPAAVAVPGTSALLVPMAAALPEGAGGVKLLADLPSNAGGPFPTQQSAILLVDTMTGRPAALLDGGAITAVRTAAASAVATRHLARADSRIAGFIGAGRLARTHLEALLHVRPIDTVLVWSRSQASRNAFRDHAAALGVTAHACADPAAVVREADVLCTLTPAREPFVQGAWFRPGLHVNAVGAPPRADHREIDSEGIRISRVVVDNREVAARKSGEVLVPLAEGLIAAGHFATELGQVVAGQCPGRRSPEEITLYDSIGIGTQDIATAALVLDAARAKGLGAEVELGE